MYHVHGVLKSNEKHPLKNMKDGWKTSTGRDLKDPSELFEIEIGNSILR